MSGKHFLQVSVVLFGLVAGTLGACSQELDAQAEPSLSPAPTADRLATLIAYQKASADPPTSTPLPTDTDTPTVTSTPSITSSPTGTPTEIAVETRTASATAVAQLLPTTMPSPTAPPTNTPPPTMTPAPVTPTPYPTNTPRPTIEQLPGIEPTVVAGADFDTTGTINDHYWLARPFPRDPTNQIVDYASRNYPFGSTGAGQFQTHHGMDFQNLLGTVILATAPGTVFYAGNDLTTQFGPRNDFYGNLVVIQHDIFAPNGDPIYTLYGHMFRIEVEIGQRVEVGTKLGTVGSSGVALGAHLHLEVRLGDPFDYNNVYNPDLWVRPWPGYGTLAGRIYDRDGHQQYDLNIIIQPESGLDHYAYSYADDDVNSDPYYGEHFTCGDLPAGNYQVLVRLRGVLRYKGSVTIEAGKTAWLEIHMN